MDTTVAIVLLSILCASVGGAHGACRPVKNEDMVEYHCVGGHPADLYALPPNTGKIKIMKMHIPRITTDMFSKFGSELWVLGCSHCGIEDIDDDAFHQLDNLEQLSLDNNRLTNVRAAWFRGLDSLTYLDLNYNKIRNVESGVFANLPSLVDLRLSGNELECLNLRDMSHLTELKRMFLSENNELKCPNAIGQFLEDHGVSFEPDPEWRRIPTDLVVPPSLEAPTTYSSFREQLYSMTSTTFSPPEHRTTQSSPTSYHPKEEILDASELVTPTWLSSADNEVAPENYHPPTRAPEPSRHQTYDYDDSYPDYNDARAPDTPPPAVAPPLQPPATPHPEPADNLGETADGAWRSGAAEPRTPSPWENESEHYDEPRFSPDPTRPPSLAVVPVQRPEDAGDFEEADTERTPDPHFTNWTPKEDDRFFAAPHPVPDDASDYALPTDDIPEEPAYNSVEYDDRSVSRPPAPPAEPEEVYSSGVGDMGHGTYYEPTVTVHPATPRPRPSLENYQRPEPEATTSEVRPMEMTTTDKPLPDCPSLGARSLDSPQLALALLAALLVTVGPVLLEGF